MEITLTDGQFQRIQKVMKGTEREDYFADSVIALWPRFLRFFCVPIYGMTTENYVNAVHGLPDHKRTEISHIVFRTKK